MARAPTTTSPPGPPTLNPLADEEALRSYFVGRSLTEVGTPAAVIDASIARRNCHLMLDAVADLGLEFRAHVKTHKTTQLTRWQVGDESPNVRLAVSTITEAESLLPYLRECQSKGRTVSLLHGIPLPPSAIERLARVAKQLGEGSLVVMIDHLDQLPALDQFRSLAGFAVEVFVKVDTGYHRAGVPPDTTDLIGLMNKVRYLEDSGQLVLKGLYSHAGDSYGGSSATDAMDRLADEIEQSVLAAKNSSKNVGKLTLSVGATPTALSLQNLKHAASNRLSKAIASAKESFDLELHAGVYPLLDIQQVSTHARLFPENGVTDIGITILAEVASLYTFRTPPQALIAAGCLALGREPCKDYKGFGVLTSWGLDRALPASPLKEGIIVAKVSQEHGILSWANGENNAALPLHIGQKLKIYPNHACVAGAWYDFYLIVDSEKDPTASMIEDVWVRWRGW